MIKFSSLKYILHGLIVESKNVASCLASDHHLAILGKISEGRCEFHLLVMLPLSLHMLGVFGFGICLFDPPLRFGLGNFQPGLCVLSDDLRLGVRDNMLLLPVGLGLLEDLKGLGF